MKRSLNILLAASLISLLATSCVFNTTPSVTGSGPVIEEARSISGFTGIMVASGVDVYLSQGPEFEVVVEADENLHEIILTELEGNNLLVGTEGWNIRSAKAKRVHVTMPEIVKISVSSAGDCLGQTPFRCDDLILNVSSAGDVALEVDADRIDVNISSSGNAQLSGSASLLDVTLSSAGDLHAYELDAAEVHVNVSSAGSARVRASEEISMLSSSAGSVYYKGDAKVVRSSSSSAGNIVKKD